MFHQREGKGEKGKEEQDPMTHILCHLLPCLIGQGVKAKFTHTAAQGYDQHPIALIPRGAISL